jgi:hypothetical protein
MLRLQRKVKLTRNDKWSAFYSARQHFSLRSCWLGELANVRCGWVKSRKTPDEHMSSALPPRTDIASSAAKTARDHICQAANMEKPRWRNSEAYSANSVNQSVQYAALLALAEANRAITPRLHIGGRLEGGYRFAIPNVGWPGQSGFTPYAAVQVQAFRTPSYSETALSGSSVFALSYGARTITTTRTELGTWLDWSIPIDYGTRLTLLGRAAWAHDNWSAPNITAGFQALPGSIFVVTGAAPATDLALVSAGVEIGFRNGFSVGARFDGEFAENSTKYSGMGRLRYTW